MSLAGYQDKIAVFRDEEGRLFLVEGELASTHILKPAPRNPVVKHLVLNEFFCMTLARQVKLDVANVELIRVPEPELLIERFDRRLSRNWTSVKRIHVIDVLPSPRSSTCLQVRTEFRQWRGREAHPRRRQLEADVRPHSTL